MTKALVFATHGSEEMELVIIVDILRRAKIQVEIFGLELNGKKTLTCSRNVKITPDLFESDKIDWESYDVFIVPGGQPGTETLSKSQTVLEQLKNAYNKKKLIAAVCAASLVIQAADLFKGSKITSHPSVEEKLNKEYTYSTERVVTNENLITSRGPGTSFEFALEIARKFVSSEEVQAIKSGLILP